MVISYYGLITFHFIEWIKYKKNKSISPLVRQEVGHNAKKQRHDVRR